MARPYSIDLRERVVAAVEGGGMSRNQAAAHFGVAISTAIKWVDRSRKLGTLPQALRQSITFDRGTEFAAYPVLKQRLGIDSYFCQPQAPWQKGSIANGGQAGSPLAAE